MSQHPVGPRGIPSAQPARPLVTRLRRSAARAWHLAVSPRSAPRIVNPSDPGPRLPLARRARRSAARTWHLNVHPQLNMRNAAFSLVAIGVLTCLVPFGIVGYGMWQENQLTQTWQQAVAQTPPPTAVVEGPATSSTDTPTQPSAAPSAPAAAARKPAVSAPPALFAIRVPKIDYYAAVRQGVSTSILAVGPGHYPATGMPGSPGLVGVAAHNTYWIPFGKLGPGDIVILQTQTAQYTYQITGTEIVNPDDRTIIVTSTTPRLVLTTCWPLWAGALATQRLAIFANLVS